MRATLKILFVGMTFLMHSMVWGQSTVSAQSTNLQDFNAAEQELIKVSDLLSASTLTDGDGWQAYGEFLHKRFNRWSHGGEVIDRKTSVDLIKDWWEGGNRQAASESKVVSIQIVDSTATIRKTIKESYIDNEGNDAGSFSGFVVQVWVKQDREWKLVSATIQKTDRP